MRVVACYNRDRHELVLYADQEEVGRYLLEPGRSGCVAADVPEPEGFRYGDDRTIHRTGLVDLELEGAEHWGKDPVVSAWFRCAALPFQVTVVGRERANEMRRMYRASPPEPLTAVVFGGRKP